MARKGVFSFDKVVMQGPFFNSFAVQDILDADVYLNRAMAGAEETIMLGDGCGRDGVAVPDARGAIGPGGFRDRGAKLDFANLDVVAAVQVVVGHELEEILQVRLVGLELLAHDHALL
jgi:hypothetical protein